MTNLDEAAANKPELTDEELTKMDTYATFYSGCDAPGIDKIRRDVIILIAELRRLRRQPTIRDLRGWMREQPTEYYWITCKILSGADPVTIQNDARELLKRGEVPEWIQVAAKDPESALDFLIAEVAEWKAEKEKMK